MVEGVTGFGGFGVLDVALLAPDGTAYQAAEMAVEVEPHVREDCLIAIHDWSPSSLDLESRLTRPDRVIGVSPSFPVDRFPLLEILPTSWTSADAVAEMRRLSRRCGLTPVLVRGSAPTPGIRLLSVYLAEALRMLGAGASIETIDTAMEDFAIPVGPFRRMDAIGTARVGRMLSRVTATLGGRFAPAAPLLDLAATGETFYRYRAGRPVGPAARLPAAAAEADGDEFSLGIRRRILLLLINEAARILEDECVENPADLDLISILALGFPREQGGLLYYAQSTGLAAIVDDLHAEARLGRDYFAPAALLTRLAAQGRGFFPEPQARSGHDSDAVLQ